MNYHNQLTQIALANTVHLATYICKASAAFIYLNPSHKALQSRTIKFGWISEPLPSASNFYNITLRNHDITVLNSLQSNPELVNDPLLRLYPKLACWVGIPLKNSTNHLFGILCILDTIPHEVDSIQKQLLAQTIRQLVLQIEMQERLRSAEKAIKKMEIKQERCDAINAFLVKLQTINDKKEFYSLLATDLPQMLASDQGKIYIFSDNFLYAKCVVKWGEKSGLADGTTEEYQTSEMSSLLIKSLKNKTKDKRDTLQVLDCQPFSSRMIRCDPVEGCYIILSSHGERLGLLQIKHPGTDLLSDDDLFPKIIFHISATLYHLRLLENLRVKSLRDPLTGLFNRRYMLESLEKICRSSTSGLCISIILIDIDHFKRLNDTFGHPAGDTVLREFSDFLQGYVRRTDIACRYGGEEFLLILPGASLEVAYRRAERLRKGLSYLTIKHNEYVIGTISVSIGIATAPEHGQIPQDLIHAADTALYKAKRGGRNRSVCAASCEGEYPL